SVNSQVRPSSDTVQRWSRPGAARPSGPVLTSGALVSVRTSGLTSIDPLVSPIVRGAPAGGPALTADVRSHAAPPSPSARQSGHGTRRRAARAVQDVRTADDVDTSAMVPRASRGRTPRHVAEMYHTGSLLGHVRRIVDD